MNAVLVTGILLILGGAALYSYARIVQEKFGRAKRQLEPEPAPSFVPPKTPSTYYVPRASTHFDGVEVPDHMPDEIV